MTFTFGLVCGALIAVLLFTIIGSITQRDGLKVVMSALAHHSEICKQLERHVNDLRSTELLLCELRTQNAIYKPEENQG